MKRLISTKHERVFPQDLVVAANLTVISIMSCIWFAGAKSPDATSDAGRHCQVQSTAQQAENRHSQELVKDIVEMEKAEKYVDQDCCMVAMVNLQL